MKKFKLFLLAMFISATSYAQYYGVDGGIIAGSLIARHLIEAKHYKEIEKWQDYILAANALVAGEMTKLNSLEKKLYKGYSELDENIKSAQLILLIIDESERIYSTAEDIIEVGNKDLSLQAYTLDQQVFLISEVVFIMNDYLIATKEGKKNLLNSADRYFLLDFFYKRIVKLRQQAEELYQLTNSIYRVNLLDLDNQEAITIDFTPLHTEMIEIYQRIFPETLKDEE